ncbi:hydrogenase maturation protease [candidate division KSB1 bacterium]|nr:hydrogenase maturation protease [candidate division KSB1 bacterium]RQW05463.1 MAG: hydrogenase maturation protease [candidate division KSB1 bacterium]
MNFIDFKKSINKPADQVVFVGLGNKARGDDVAGLLFLRELKKRPEYQLSSFIEAATNPENYLERILDFHPLLVVFVDAANVGTTPGDMEWIDSGDLDTARISTHAFHISLVEHYLKIHQPLEVRYFGIRPESTTIGRPVSDAVQQKIKMFFTQ